MTIDFGAHVYPETVFPEPIAGSPLENLLGEKLRNPTELRRQYDAAGIDGAVLSQPYYMGFDDAERTAAANDALLEIINHDERFFGLAAIPVTAGGEAAAAEFERALDAGYNGGALETRTSDVELVDKQVEPVFEVANRTGAPILVHPKLDESLHPDVLDDTYLLNATFGREAALAESICKVIHEDILDRYPNLTLVYHHLGGNIASMLGRVHLQLDAGRWPGQDHVKVYEEFKKQLEERIYVDTSGFFGYHAPLRATFEEFPASNILFGTDYPFEPRSAEELGEFVESIETLTPAVTARNVLEENAMRLLVNV